MFRLTLRHVERYPESPSKNSSSEVLKVSAIKRQSSNHHHIQHNTKTLSVKEREGEKGGEREGERERERAYQNQEQE